MLLRTAQTCHDDADASHRSHILELSARMKQLEELVQRQLVASAPVSAAADAYTVRAVAERLTLLEQHLSEGLSANHSAHTQNSEVFGALEARLASLESAPAARAKESTANVVAPVKAACLDAVEGRLNRFECEVQARLLLATAGETPAQRAVEQQQQQQQAEQQQAEQQRQLDAALARFQELLAYSIDGLAVGSSSGGAVPAAPLDARAVEALVDARMEVALAGMRGELADVGAEVEELRGEAAGAVTRRQMLQLLAQLRALSGVHASMRGAIGALAAAAPRLRQSVAVPGNGGGAGSGGAAAGQAALAEHVEALAAVLSRQLDHAVELATGAVGASVDAAGEDADDGAAGGGSGGADVALQVPQPRPRGRAPVPARASAHAPLHLREPVEEPLLSPTGQGGHLDAEQSGQQQQRAVAGARDAGRPRAAAAAEHAAVGGRPQAQAAAHQQAAGRQRAAGHEAAVGGQSPTQAAAVAEQALELERCGVRPGALAAQPAQVQDVQERSQAAIHHKQVALKQLVRELARELQPIMVRESESSAATAGGGRDGAAAATTAHPHGGQGAGCKGRGEGGGSAERRGDAAATASGVGGPSPLLSAASRMNRPAAGATVQQQQQRGKAKGGPGDSKMQALQQQQQQQRSGGGAPPPDGQDSVTKKSEDAKKRHQRLRNLYAEFAHVRK